MKHLSQSGSSNFCPELRKNALISQSHFSNFALHVIKEEITRKCMLELNTEEGFMVYTAHEDVQRLRAVYAINPDFRGI